jgi:hypothetical protein
MNTFKDTYAFLTVRTLLLVIVASLHSKNMNITHLNINFFNSIQLFIIYVPSQQPQGQLQAQHSVDTDNYIIDKHNIKLGTS